MADVEKVIPKFQNPPIVEKLMGIQFSPLEQWSIPHFGLFWQEIRDEFPRFEIQPPLLRREQSVKIEDSIRCWFLHQSQTKLIQIQRDRFLYNWQKPTTYEEYPHYDSIRPEFAAFRKRFYDFLEKSQISKPTIDQCEITYINHLEKGIGWERISDLPGVINCWSGLSGKLLHAEPDLVNIQIAYSLPEISGNLSILLQPALRNEDSQEVLQLRITVTGEPASQNIDDVLSWFDAGRDCAVESFIDLTTEKMHKIWGIMA
jgi:uncharacterized protein (TIGR04255 family)